MSLPRVFKSVQPAILSVGRLLVLGVLASPGRGGEPLAFARTIVCGH